MRGVLLLAWPGPGFVFVEQGVQRVLSTAGASEQQKSDISYILGVVV